MTRILFQQSFFRQDVDIYWQNQPIQLPEQYEKWCEIVWQTRKPQTFDGKIARLEDWSIRNEKLELYLCPVFYRTLLASNSFCQEICRDLGTYYCARALGLSVVIISCDERYFCIKRSQAVEEYPGYWDIVGGHIDCGNDAPDVFAAICQEIEEETALTTTDSDIECYALMLDEKKHKPELLFIYKSSLLSTEIENNSKKATDRFEYQNCALFTREQIKDLQSNEPELITPSLMTAFDIIFQKEG